MSDAEVVYSCDICRKVVASKPILKLHYKRVHKICKGQLKKTTFSSLPDGTRSKMPTVGGGNLKVKVANMCDQCGDTFASTAALVQHFSSCSGRSKSGEGERSATASASSGRVGKDLERSAALEPSNEGFQCHLCDQVLGRRDSLKRHLTMSHKLSNTDANRELDKRSGDPRAACEHCGIEMNKKQLVIHYRICKKLNRVKKVPRGVQEANGSQDLNVSRERAGKKPRTNPSTKQASNSREEQPATFSHATTSTPGAVAADFPITPETMDSDFEIKKEIKMEIKEESSDE